MKKNSFKYCLIIVLLFFYLFSLAQNIKEKEKPKPITRILIVFDASQSMYGRWQSDIKINIAKKVISNTLDSLRNIKNLELALRVYGHQYYYPPQVCTDTKLEVPFGKNNISSIKHKLNTLTPKGTSPIAYSLEQAGNDFPECDNCRNIIVLITDGIEECGGDPCAVSKELQKKGVVLKPFVIGIGKNFRDAFDCVGNYFDASSENHFRKALKSVISQVLNSTTVQINLLDSFGKPTETNVNMTFYDHLSGLVKYNFIHTLNNKGLPDTLIIDPLLAYDIVVHTLPPIKVDSIKLTPGKHTIIPISVPQGYLKLKVGNNDKFVKNLSCIVRECSKQKIINIQSFSKKEKYIVGRYDLEILCLPRLNIDSIEIKQSYTTTVKIPMPGIAVIHKSVKGYGSLYVKENNKLKWIYNLRKNNIQESIVLEPGVYHVVFRSIYADKSDYTIEKSFNIHSGLTSNVRLYQ